MKFLRKQDWPFWALCGAMVICAIWGVADMRAKAANTWSPPEHLTEKLKKIQTSVENMSSEDKHEYEVYARKLFVEAADRIVTAELQKISDGSWRD